MFSSVRSFLSPRTHAVLRVYSARETVFAPGPGVVTQALVSLIKWCKEDKSSFEKIMNLVDEAERTPEEMEYMSYANFLYSGVDGYSK